MRAGLVRSIAVSLVASMIGVTASVHLVRASQPSYFDQTFGTDGVSTIVIPPLISDSSFDDVRIDATGKLLTLISVEGPTGRVAISRRTAELVVDTSFGTNGTTDFIDLTMPSMLLQSDGKILLAGIESNDSGKKIAVRRYLNNGQIDQSFATQGVASIFDIPGKGFVDGPLLSVDESTGRIVLAINIDDGSGSEQNFYFFALTEYGKRDNNWGNLGGREIIPRRTTAPWGAPKSYLTDMVVLGDGSLIALGYVYTENIGRQIVLIKLTSWGSLDATFDGQVSPGNVGNGIVTESFGYSDAYMTAITLLNNGNVVVAGAFGNYVGPWSWNGPWSYGAAQVSAVDGIPVSTFGTMGSFNTNEPMEIYKKSLPRRVLQTSSGEFIFSTGQTSKASIISINSTGTSFNSYVWTIGPASSNALQLTADGTIVIAGQSTDGGKNALIARISSNGIPMTGATGYTVEELRLTHVNSKIVKSLPQSNGTTIALMDSSYIDKWGFDERFRPVIARLTSTGTPDVNFGISGFSEFTSPDNSLSYFARDVVVQPDGKIVVLIQETSYPHVSMVVWRLLSDGRVDEDFGTGGQVVISMTETNIYPKSLVITEDGKILLTGDLESQSWFFKLNSNGDVDTFFKDCNNIDGRVRIIFNTYDVSDSYAFQDLQGRVLVAGTANVPDQSNAVLARYLQDGTLDPSFSADGFLTFPNVPFSVDWLVDAVVTATGDIVAVAVSLNPDRASVLIRIRSNGTLDTSFNSTGLKWFNLQSGADSTFASSVTASDTGYVVVGNGCERTLDGEDRTCSAAFGRIGTTGEFDGAFGTDGISIVSSLGDTQLNHVASINDSYQLVSGRVRDANRNTNGILIRVGNTPSAPTSTVPTSTVPTSTVPTSTVPTSTVPTSTVPQSPPSTVGVTQSTVPVTTEPTSTVPGTTVPVKLVIAVSQTTILKNMNLSVPKGGVATMSIAKSAAKVCKVVKKQVLGTAIGTCRVSVTIKTKSKKSVTKSMAFKVSG